MGKLYIFTGSGVSAESGIQTFRGGSGLWDGYEIDKVCNYMTWKRNFDLVHEFYNARRVQLATVEPNAAHFKITEWQKRYDTVVLTQNVDDLHERAGSHDVKHLHGFLPEMRCEACGHVWNIGYKEFHARVDTCPRVKSRGSCGCRNGVKPNVVFFHEPAPSYQMFYNYLNQLTKDDVVVAIGTSGQVVPVGAYLAQSPAYTVLNNLEAATDPDSIAGLRGFNQYIYKPVTQALDELDAIIASRL